MRSSSGAHYLALEHVRALAAFMVFAWHFIHGTAGSPVRFEYSPAIIPFAILDEGHTGVALFMVLSGYLFAKLLDGRRVMYGAFFWNRMLRLLPLLLVVLFIVGVQKFLRGERPDAYLKSLAMGLLLPNLPNGGWSIVVELHFYILLPLLLWLCRKSNFLLSGLIAVALALRLFMHHQTGEVQMLSFWTIAGRIDQFVLGMFMFHMRSWVAGRHAVVVALLAGFLFFYWQFDVDGGFYGNPFYPSPNVLWVYFSTIEGLAYATAIAWYDGSFTPPDSALSRFIGRLGEYSYSLYLLHFFFVFHAARFVHEHIMNISNFYVACAWALVAFVFMFPISYLSFRFIESPFLRLRKPYIAGEYQECVARDVASVKAAS